MAVYAELHLHCVSADTVAIIIIIIKYICKAHFRDAANAVLLFLLPVIPLYHWILHLLLLRGNKRDRLETSAQG